MENLTTKELFTRRALGRACDEEVVAWAVEQVADNAPHANLSTLASLSGPLNHFEVEDLFRRSLAELGLSEPPHEETHTAFLRECAEAVLSDGLAPREACRVLAAVHRRGGERPEVEPFRLLSLGVQDLESGHHQSYYPGLSLACFDQLVRKEARRLLAALEAGHDHAG